MGNMLSNYNWRPFLVISSLPINISIVDAVIVVVTNSIVSVIFGLLLF